ncbi:hypothetical protein GCM10027570_40940 [Streptomonospora sediminis]
MRPGLVGRLLIGVIVPAAAVLSRRIPPRRMRRSLARLAAGARPACHTEAKLARDQILTVSPRCRGRSACLVRSVSVALLCRLRGTWPTWCVGVVAAPPFAAHAWIEAEDRMVGEPLDSSCYRTFFTVPPSGKAAAAGARGGNRAAGNLGRKEV